MRQLTQKQINFFWSHINKTETCWLWTGAVHDKGYGYFSRPKFYAHRVMWLLHYGQDPGALDVLHKCDNPICINPNHLFLGTQADNAKDMVNKDRHAIGEFAKSKLLNEDVVYIKTQLFHNHLRIIDLANEFGVDWRTIYDIKIGRTWKHIPWPNG